MGEENLKIWQYIAFMSKGRVENDRDKVFKYLLSNLKHTCDVITDLMQEDLCKNSFYIENCEKYKDCICCLNFFLDEEVENENLPGM